MEPLRQPDWHSLPAEQAYDFASAEKRVRAISATAMSAAGISRETGSVQNHDPFILMADMSEAQEALMHAELQAEKWLRKQHRESALAWVSEQIGTCGLRVAELARLSGIRADHIASYSHKRKQPGIAHMASLSEAIAKARDLQEDDHRQFLETANTHAYIPRSSRQCHAAPAFQGWLGDILQEPALYIRKLSRRTELTEDQVYSMFHKGTGVTAKRVFALVTASADILKLKDTELYDFMRTSLITCHVLPETWPDKP